MRTFSDSAMLPQCLSKSWVNILVVFYSLLQNAFISSNLRMVLSTNWQYDSQFLLFSLNLSDATLKFLAGLHGLLIQLWKGSLMFRKPTPGKFYWTVLNRFDRVLFAYYELLSKMYSSIGDRGLVKLITLHFFKL